MKSILFFYTEKSGGWNKHQPLLYDDVILLARPRIFLMNHGCTNLPFKKASSVNNDLVVIKSNLFYSIRAKKVHTDTIQYTQLFRQYSYLLKLSCFTQVKVHQNLMGLDTDTIQATLIMV